MNSSVSLLSRGGYVNFQGGTHPIRGRDSSGKGAIDVCDALGNIGFGHAIGHSAMDTLRGSHTDLRYAAWTTPRSGSCAFERWGVVSEVRLRHEKYGWSLEAKLPEGESRAEFILV